MARPDLTHRSGFTLMELLLVVMILSATALLAISSLEGAQEQARFEETRARWTVVREAIVGGRRAGPSAAEGSFVDDIGRLPNSLLELIERFDLPPWDIDPLIGAGAGWRGPYLPVRLEGNYPSPFPTAPPLAGLSRRTFRDGWGLAFDERDATALAWQGWRPPVEPLEPNYFFLQSWGSDGAIGGIGYGAEFPPDIPGLGPPPLVSSGDWLLDLRGARIEVTFVDFPAGFAGRAVRLRCLHPRNGTFAWPAPPESWPAQADRDATPWLSESHELLAPVEGDRTVLVFQFLVPENHAKRVPVGRRAFQVVLDDDLDGQAGDALGPAQWPHAAQLEARTGAPMASFEWKVSP